MNKIAKMMCLVAVIALIGTSCKKKENTATFQGTFVEMNVAEEGAKTYTVGSRIQWDANDKVELFNVAVGNNTFEHGTYQVSGSGGATVHFTPISSGNAISTTNMGAFYGFYPSGNQGGLEGGFQEAEAYGDGHVTATYLLPPTQNYRTINGAPALPQYSFAAAAKDEQTSYLGNVNFNFQTICGILWLRYWIRPQYANNDGKRVASITVEDRLVHTTGLIQMYIDKINPTDLMTWLDNFDPDNEAYMESLMSYKQEIGYYVPSAENLSKVVTLNCRTAENANKGVKLSNNVNNPTSFYIGLRPAAAARGMKITLNYADGTYYVVYDLPTNNLIKPNTIKKMATREAAVTM